MFENAEIRKRKNNRIKKENGIFHKCPIIVQRRNPQDVDRGK
jgi:hypothetical protein